MKIKIDNLSSKSFTYQRRNYLIYEYFKNELKSTQLADSFRNILQDDVNTKWIHFYGLPSLSEIIDSYFNHVSICTQSSFNGLENDSPVQNMNVSGDFNSEIPVSQNVASPNINKKKSDSTNYRLKDQALSKKPVPQKVATLVQKSSEDSCSEDEAPSKKSVPQKVATPVQKKKESSSEDSSSENEAPSKKSVPQKVATPVQKKKESSSEDSSSEDEAPSKKPVPQKVATPVQKKKESSSEDSSSEDEAPSKKPVPQKVATPIQKKKESINEDSSSEDEAPSRKPVPRKVATPIQKKKESSSEDSSSEDDEAPKRKILSNFSLNKRKLSGSEILENNPSKKLKSRESSTSGVSSDNSSNIASSKRHQNDTNDTELPSTKKARHSAPFRRVREESVLIRNEKLKDNSYEALPGARDSWGFKANSDLKNTQGKSFRHEKTKKKRGSYKGGAINTGVASIVFDSD